MHTDRKINMQTNQCAIKEHVCSQREKRMPVTIHDTISQSVLIPLQLQAHISVPSGLLQNKQECRPGFSRQLCAMVETKQVQKKAY